MTSPSDRPDRPLTLRIHVSGDFASSSEGTHARIREIVREADRIFSMLGKGVMVVRSEDTDEERERRDTVAIFLHELGHALGARHDDVPGGIMNGHATGRARTYGEEAAQIIQQGLAAHGIVAEHRDRRAQAADGGSWTMTQADRSALDAAETRCKTAEARGLDWSDVREECAPLMKLMMQGAGDGAAVE